MEISPAASQLGGDLGDGHGAELVARAAHALSRAGEAASSGAGASVDEGSGVRPDRTKTLLLQLLGIALPDERKGPLAAGPMDASASRNALALAIDSAPDIESVTNSDGRFGHWGGADAPHPRDMLSLVVQPVRHFPRRLNDEETAGDLQGQVKLATLSLKLVLERRPCQAPNLPALNRWQGRRCAACGCGITTGMFGTSSSAACYCWYSELLLCPPCFRGGAAGSSLDPDSGAKLRWRTLPWRMMHRLEPSSSNPGGTKVSRSSGDASAVSWAFPVCAQAAKFIDKITTLPVVEMSLWAPHLFFGPGGPPPGCIVRIAAGGRAGHLVWKIDPQFGSCMDAESGRIDPVDARGVTEEVLAGLRRICVSRLSSGEETADEPCDDYLTCIATGAPLDPPVKPRQPLGDVALARERRRRRLATAPRHLQTMRRLRRQMLRAAIALALASDVSEEALLGVAMQFARDALAVALVVAFARGSRISLPKRVVMQARAGATESIADNVIQDDGSSNVSEATDLDMAVGRSAASVLAHFPKDKVAKAVSQVQDLVGTLCSHEERLSLVHVVRASTGVLNPPLGDAAAALADRLPSQCVLPTLPLSMQATVQLPSDVDEDRAAGNVESMRRARALHIEVAGPSVGTADDTVIWSTDRSIAPSNTESPESV